MVQIGAIKSSSLIFKTFFQMTIPILQDSGVTSKCFPGGTFSHFLAVVSILLSSGIYFSIPLAVKDKNIPLLVLLKTILSTLSVLSSLTDSIVARTVQEYNLVYSTQQMVQSIAWSFALLVAGYFIQVFGDEVLFPLVVCPKMAVAVLLYTLCSIAPLGVNNSVDDGPKMSLVGEYRALLQTTMFMKLFVSIGVWGSCFAVMETLTLYQMKTEFQFNNATTGYSSVFSIAGSVLVYYHTEYIIEKLGVHNLILVGIYSGVLFLVIQSLLSFETRIVSIATCGIRSFAYSCIWAGVMQLVLTEVDRNILTSVHNVINILWFTIGNTVAYTAWVRFYEDFGARDTYFLCAVVLLGTSLLQDMGSIRRRFRIMTLFCFSLGALLLEYFNSSND